MNIGERIKQRRKELNLSVDDVANRLNKNRATIYRYESNDIENLPITILEPLAQILQTTPIYLLGLEDKQNKGAQTKDENNFSDEEIKIINKYRTLDSKGKHTVKTVLNMEYVRCNNVLMAAHEKEGMDKNSPEYKEAYEHDINIMMDDDEWK